MSPLELEILLHYYTRADDYRGGDFSAPAVRDAVDNFIEIEILKANSVPGWERKLELSTGGQMYVKALLDLPLPQQVWALKWPNQEAFDV